MMQKAKHFDKIEYRSSFPAAHNLCLLLPNVAAATTKLVLVASTWFFVFSLLFTSSLSTFERL